MKYMIIMLCILMTIGIVASCRDSKEKNGTSFNAIVLDKGETSLIVEPEEGSSELLSADKISVSIEEAVLMDSEGEGITINDIEAEDRVQIFYNGGIAESYPAQIYGCYKVVLLR